MADDVTKISSLAESTDFANLFTIGTHTDGQGNVTSKKVSLANLLKVIDSVDITPSSEDGGTNIVVFHLLNGTTYTLNVLNGTKGSQGIQGPTGATGDTGPKGDTGNGISSIEAVSVSTESGGHSVYRITMTSGETFDFTVYNGNEFAENLQSWAGSTLDAIYTQEEIVETTGGDLSIDSSVPANLLELRPKTDFSAQNLIATGFNLLRFATAVGAGWYIPVPALPYGAITTAAMPNGVLFTDSEGNNLRPTVYFKPLSQGVPTSVTDGSACAYTDASTGGKSYRFFTTSQPGYLIVSGIDRAATCMHIGWSRRYDEYKAIDDPSDAGGSVALSSGISALHNYGMMLIVGNVADYIERTSATQVTWHRLVERVQPTWTNTLQEDGETYLHEAVITGMKSNGAAAFMSENIAVSIDGTTVSYTDKNAEASTDYIKYELASPASGTANVSSTFAVEDWGLIIITGASGKAYFDIAYAQGIPDSLREIAAHGFSSHKEDIDALTEEIKACGYKVPFEAAFDRMPTLGGQPGILFCDGAPTASNKPTNWIDFLDGGYNWTGLPNVEGQHVLDFTNHVDYYGWLNPETNLLEWKH